MRCNVRTCFHGSVKLSTLMTLLCSNFLPAVDFFVVFILPRFFFSFVTTRSVKSQKIHVTHSHVPRTIVVKLFNKISLVRVTAAAILPFRILFRSFEIQFLPAQVRSKGAEGAGSSRSNGNACDFRAAPALRGTKSRSHITSRVGFERAWGSL